MSWKYSGVGEPSAKSRTKFDNIVLAIQKNDVKTIKRLKIKSLNLIDQNKLTVLHVAARWGKEETLRILLENSNIIKLINVEMYNGDTPLLAAAKNGNATAVRVLSDYGADINCREAYSDNTPLHFAAKVADCDLMNTILSRGPSPNLINALNRHGDSALHIALFRHSPTVPLLLQAGADYFQPNPLTGRNMLHVSVVSGQCGIVQELLTSKDSQRLAYLSDKRGDTSLMLAVHVACPMCVKTLLPCTQPGAETNHHTQQNVLHMAVETDNEEILKYLLMFSHELTINQTDCDGLTPLLLAIKKQKNRCLERLMKTQNIYVKNRKTRETALHMVIRADNRSALSMLINNRNATAWSLVQKDSEGNTPLWVAVECGHAKFIVEARRAELIKVNELNERGDTTMFVAAACGHLNVLKALLLSHRYYEFLSQHSNIKDLQEQMLIKSAEICCDIYSTDIYILTRNEEEKQKLNVWIPEQFFYVNNLTGKNIFHACSIGGSIECLEFVYNYFKLFFGLSLFDAEDNEGNTPLHLATRNSLGRDCVYFYLKNGANISSTNKFGESALQSLLNHHVAAMSFLISVLNEGITYDTSVRGLRGERECVHVDYSIFRIPNEPVTKVVRLFYDTIQGPHRDQLLQHTLFKTYTHLITTIVNYVFVIRFILACASTTLLTIYLMFFSAKEVEINHYVLIAGFKYSLGFVSILGALFTVPFLWHELLHRVAVLMNVLMLLPCFMTFFLILLPHGSDFFFEIASLTVLLSWLTLMMYSSTIFLDISRQVVILYQVIYGMIMYFGVVILVLLPFSLIFFCIFNDNVYFATPIKSLIYTCIILLKGDIKDTFNYFETKHFDKLPRNASNSHFDLLSEQFDLIFESSFLLFFLIGCVLGLMNMLVGLSVRDAKVLTEEGEVFRRLLHIHWVNSLELFLQSRFYNLIQRTPFIYLFGIVPSWTVFDPQVRYSASVVSKDNTDKSRVFPVKSVIELKKSVSLREPIHFKQFSE